MKYHSILTGVLLAVSISSSAFCDSEIREQNEKKVGSNSRIEEKEFTLFKPIFHLNPSGKGTNSGNKDELRKGEAIDFPQFKPDTSPTRNREQVEKHSVLYRGQQSDLHPGSQPMMDMNTANQIYQQQAIPQNMSNFQNSLNNIK